MHEIGLSYKNYIQFLQFSLDKQTGLPASAKEMDWRRMMAEGEI